jgi:hypothetical protein
MRKWLVCVTAVALLTGGADATARQRPDLSGTWVANPDASAPASGRPAPPNFGPQFSITHAEPALTLTRTFAGAPATINYLLDGSEVASRMPARLCEADSGAKWTAVWDGSAVVITLVGAVPPNGKTVKMDVRSSLTLASPDTLRVDVTAQTAGQAAPRTTTTVYKRTGPPPPPAPALLPKAKATMAQLAWLAGVWTGARGSSTPETKIPETKIEERWTPAAGGSMLAISRTLRDGLMPAFEFLCIVERDVREPHARFPEDDPLREASGWIARGRDQRRRRREAAVVRVQAPGMSAIVGLLLPPHLE